MTVQDWLAAAIADAERRGLAAMRPLLETLARATEGLRNAEAVQRDLESQQQGRDPRT